MKKFDSRSSSGSAQAKQELINDVGSAVAVWQHAVQTFDEAAAQWLGINLTDLRCLGSLYRDGSATAGHLAKVAGITAGATTAAIDRLQRLGYVQRVRDTPDRRQVRVELTGLLLERFDQIWGPLVRDSQAALQRSTMAELTQFRDLLQRNTAIQQTHALRLRQLPPLN